MSARISVVRNTSGKSRPPQCEARRRHIYGPLRPMDYPHESLISRLLRLFRK